MGEGLKVIAIAGVMCTLAHFRRTKSSMLIVDHPAFGYLSENILCMGIAYFVDNHLPTVDENRIIYSFLITLLRGFFMVNSGLLFEQLSATILYSHVPYFSQNKPVPDIWTILNDYARCNLVVDLMNSVIQVGILLHLSDDDREWIVKNPAPLCVSTYMLKFAISRVTVDIVFGLVHRFMHQNKWVYQNIHRLHHEHTTPRTQTNLHFMWLDQFIEAVFPIYVSFGVLGMIGLMPTRYEQTLLVMTLVYYESASHTGKEIPIVTWFPYLSPFVDWISGCDQRLIEYHTRHHQLYRCNYSISPWWDKFVGTYRMDLPEEYDKQESFE